MSKSYAYLLALSFSFVTFIAGCKKYEEPTTINTALSLTVNGINNGTLIYGGLQPKPVVEFTFTQALDPATVSSGVTLADAAGVNVPLTSTLLNNNTTLRLTPQDNLRSFATYTLRVQNTLRTASGGTLVNPVTLTLRTGLDSSDKFPRIPDEELLTLVQRQTFKYFWDFAHPVSGLAR